MKLRDLPSSAFPPESDYRKRLSRVHEMDCHHGLERQASRFHKTSMTFSSGIDITGFPIEKAARRSSWPSRAAQCSGAIPSALTAKPCRPPNKNTNKHLDRLETRRIGKGLKVPLTAFNNFIKRGSASLSRIYLCDTFTPGIGMVLWP